MYSQVILDALMEKSTDSQISRMVVIINEFSAYRDFADLHKHDPKWWKELADKIHSDSPHPNMAKAPYIIAAGQYLLDATPDTLEEHVVPLVTKAMVIDEDFGPTQTLAKLTMAVRMGAVDIPSLEDMRKHVLPKLTKAVKDLDKKLTYTE